MLPREAVLIGQQCSTGQKLYGANAHASQETLENRTIVPPKLTPFCNVLDAVVIKVFKSYMRLYGDCVEGDE